MRTFLDNLRFSLRGIAKKPAFAIVVVLTLALGIGANTTIFTVVNAYLLRPLPFNESEQLVSLNDLQPPNDPTPASFPEFSDWRKGNQVFRDVTGQASASLNLIGRRQPERVLGVLVSENYFAMLGVQPVAGRTFRAEENRPGAGPVVVISRELWRREFNGASDAIGKTITLNRTNYTVVGVVDGTPLRTVASPKAELWIPLERAIPYTQRGMHYLRVMARLKPGVGMSRPARISKFSLTGWTQYKTGHGITALPLREQLFGNVHLGLLLLLGAAGFLLLIATANVANILLARASARAKEFAIRAALGAGRARLISQTMAESLLLSSLGGVAGFLFALWGSDLLRPRLAALHSPTRELLPGLAGASVFDLRVPAFRSLVRTGACFYKLGLLGLERDIERRLVPTERLRPQQAAKRTGGFSNRDCSAYWSLGIVAQFRPSAGGGSGISG